MKYGTEPCRQLGERAAGLRQDWALHGQGTARSPSGQSQRESGRNGRNKVRR